MNSDNPFTQKRYVNNNVMYERQFLVLEIVNPILELGYILINQYTVPIHHSVRCQFKFSII